jgi:hypothetical protein
MNTGLWNMDSGLAASRRPGMTNGAKQLRRSTLRDHRAAGAAPQSHSIWKIRAAVAPRIA